MTRGISGGPVGWRGRTRSENIVGLTLSGICGAVLVATFVSAALQKPSASPSALPPNYSHVAPPECLSREPASMPKLAP